MDKPGEMAVLVRVVEDGGFSAAARTLGLTPSAVSKLVSRLEDRLGARLFNRTTRRLGLTEEGEAFYRRCVRILADIAEAENAVGRFGAAPRGVLRVNTAVAFADYQIVPLLPAFADRYPEVTVELSVTDRLVDLVAEGVDVAIRLGGLADTSLISRKLADDHRIICAAPAYLARRGIPETPDDLARHACLTWTGGQAHLNHWPFDGPAGPYTRTVTGNLRTDNGETITRMALAGLGLARLAEFVVAADIRAGRLVAVLEDWHRVEPLPVYALYPHRRHLSPKVRAFVDFLVEACTPQPPWRRTPPGTESALHRR